MCPVLSLPFRRLLPGLVVLIATAPLSAASYLYIGDAALFDQATHVVQVDVLSAAAAPNAPATEYRARVGRVLKGSVDGGAILVRVPGGPGPDGLELQVPGAPSFFDGERALLFLVEAPDGSFGILHWSLGAFRQHRVGANAYALRELRDADFPIGNLGDRPERAREWTRFLDWLDDRARGLERQADYFRADSAEVLRSFYNLFRSKGRNSRWFEFDDGEPVTFKTGPGNSFGTPSLFQPSMSAWNNDNLSTVILRHSGRTGVAGGLTRSDGVNTILFDDPNNLLPGKFVCSQGGFLAAAFFWLKGTAQAGGTTYNRIVEGDVVINDGAQCLKGLSQILAEMFTHEFGHTLGIAHSCGDPTTGPCNNRSEDDATMRAQLHADGRSAAIRSDDKNAARALYRGTGGGGAPPPPAGAVLNAPTSVDAKATSGKKVKLTWDDNSTGETGQEVWLKRGKKGWTLAKTVAADATKANIKQLDPGVQYKFRVRAIAGANASAYSDSVKIKTPGGGPPAAPSELAVVATSSTSATVSWKDNSNNERAFSVQVKEGDGEFQLLQNTSANVTSVAFEGATPGATYTFRARARRGTKVSAFSNEASVTMPL